jgi:hypothetical protein
MAEEKTLFARDMSGRPLYVGEDGLIHYIDDPGEICSDSSVDLIGYVRKILLENSGKLSGQTDLRVKSTIGGNYVIETGAYKIPILIQGGICDIVDSLCWLLDDIGVGYSVEPYGGSFNFKVKLDGHLSIFNDMFTYKSILTASKHDPEKRGVVISDTI